MCIHRTVLPLAAAALVLAGCGTTSSDDPAASPTGPPDSTPDATEADGPQPRLAVTYDGGVLVVDAAAGEVLLDAEVEGFARLSPAGDGRHALLSATGGFTALDLGAWTEEHGDHGHSWTTEPRLTDFTIDAEEPGHVVAHHGRTTLFDDGTGQITAFDPVDLADLPEEPALDTWTTDQAHHGVAVQHGHGTLVSTVGDAEARTGVEVRNANGTRLSASNRCPGVHGEAFAGEVAVFGCEDGVLTVDGRELTKIDAPDPYGRIGNQAGHDASPYVLGDYKTDPEAELERPRRVSVVDTEAATIRLVDLPASYSFRSLGRTPDGDGLVLGTDGRLHLVDLATAEVTRSVPVLDPWREPTDWQQPRPLLHVAGDAAYVTDPAQDRIHVLDASTLAETGVIDLPRTPNELVGVTG